MELFWQIYDSSWGEILIVSDHVGLVCVTLPGATVAKKLNELSKNRDTILTHRNTTLIQQTKKQLQEYFEGKRKDFQLKLNAFGTTFQKKTWACLQKIPFGETRCYQDIAVMMNKPKAMRAVGMANNKNPLPIIVPCHRVIGKNGDLVGFGGGITLKQKLLNLEKKAMATQKPSKSAKKSLSLAHASHA